MEAKLIDDYAKKVIVVYVGPHPEVSVPDARLCAKRGEPVEVPAEIAASLLSQAHAWKLAVAKTARTKEA